MQVKKIDAARVRKAESIILTGGQKVVTAEQRLKSDLTASTMGEEEEERENVPMQKIYGDGLGRKVMQRVQQDIRKRSPSTERTQRKQKEKEVMVQEEKVYMSRIGRGKYKECGKRRSVPSDIISSRREKNFISNAGGEQISPRNFAEKLKAENRKRSVSKESGAATFQGKASPYTASGIVMSREKTVSGVVKTGEKAASEAAKIGGSAAAGAATAGVSVAVEKAGELIVKRAKRTKESMVASMEEREQHKKKGTGGIEENRDGGRGANTEIITGMAIIIPVLIPLVTIFLLFAIVFGAIVQTPEDDTNEGLKIVAVALQEVEDSDNNIGGGKYKQWYGMNDNWCAMFVSWCADQCGYIEEGIMPRTASVAAMKKWYMDKNLYHTQESGYEPKPGDIIIFGNGKSHTGIVIAYDEDAKELTTIEGNTGTSHTDPYHKGSRVKRKSYPLNYAYIAGYGTPEYPAEEDTEDTELLEAELNEE